MAELIGLLDCNNFFVSCERLFRPDLRGRAVAVLSSNDGCIVARSQEVKDMDIPMGVPYFQIKDIVKDGEIVCFSSNFTLYRDISRRVFAVLRQLVEGVEVYSIDEAFFRINTDEIEDVPAYLMNIKQVIEKAVGIPVSIGAAATKTQAKFVNHTAKKTTGTAVVLKDAFLSRYGEAPLHETWGVGGKMTIRYREAGITTVRSLVEAPPRRIATIFGVSGRRLQSELSGSVAYPLGSSDRPYPESIMSTRSFAKKTTDLKVIKDALSYHVQAVAKELREQDLVAREISVQLTTSRHGDYLLRGGYEARVLDVGTSDTTALWRQAEKALETLYEKEVPYNKTGVVVRGLVPFGTQATSLFADASVSLHDKTISTLLDATTARFGATAIGVGKFDKDRLWRSKQETLSPAYTTRWSDVCKVSAG